MLGNAKEQLSSHEQLNIVFWEDPERLATIQRLANALNVSVDELLK